MRNVVARATRNAVLLAGVIVLVLSALPPLLGAHWFGRDLWWVDTGILCAIERGFDAGGLWLSPHLGRSSPLFANPHAQLLYPLRWPALLLAPDAGTSFHVVIHLTGSAAATAWLSRTFGLRPLAAVATGVAFASCGTVVDLVSHSLYLVSAVWLPAAWAAARVARLPGARAYAPVLIVGCLALCLLGGDAQGFAMAGGIVLLEALVLAFVAPARRGAALRIALAVPIAALVACAQLLPTLAEAALSGRLGGNVETTLTWSLGVPGAIALVLPLSIGTPVGSTTFGGLFGATTSWNLFPHLGALALACFASVVTARRGRSAVIVSLASFLFALGAAGLVYPIVLRLLPPLAALRYPEKYLLATSIGVVVLAGMALDRASRRRSRRWTSSLSIAAVGLVLVIAFAGATQTPAASGLPAALRGAAVTALVPIMLALLLSRVGRLRAFLPVALPVAMLVPAIGQLQAGPSPFDLPWAHAGAIEDDDVVCRDRRLYGQAAVERGGERTQWNQHAAGYAFGVGEQSACHDVTSGVPYSPLRSWPEALLEGQLSVAPVDAARALGCTHVLVAPDRPSGRDLFKPPLLPVDGAAPPVSVVDDPVLTDDEGLRRALGAPELGTLTLVDDPGSQLGGRSLPGGAGITADRLVVRGPDQLSIPLSGSGGAVVLVRRSYRVGWSARQADDPLPVVRVGGTLLGVVVDDVGRGAVELSYAPPRLTAGLVASSLGLALAGLLWLWGRRRRR